jgi:hypothetical protein
MALTWAIRLAHGALFGTAIIRVRGTSPCSSEPGVVIAPSFLEFIRHIRHKPQSGLE